MEGGGGRGVGEKKVKHLLVSFIYCIVDNKIRLLSIWWREKCPYKYDSGSFARLLRLLFCRIPMKLTARVALWGVKRGHSKR